MILWLSGFTGIIIWWLSMIYCFWYLNFKMATITWFLQPWHNFVGGGGELQFFSMKKKIFNPSFSWIFLGISSNKFGFWQYYWNPRWQPSQFIVPIGPYWNNVLKFFSETTGTFKLNLTWWTFLEQIRNKFAFLIYNSRAYIIIEPFEIFFNSSVKQLEDYKTKHGIDAAWMVLFQVCANDLKFNITVKDCCVFRL